jgi:hypothetical protein
VNQIEGAQEQYLVMTQWLMATLVEYGGAVSVSRESVEKIEDGVENFYLTSEFMGELGDRDYWEIRLHDKREESVDATE